jgi:hypothetical protein
MAQDKIVCHANVVGTVHTKKVYKDKIKQMHDDHKMFIFPSRERLAIKIADLSTN